MQKSSKQETKDRYREEKELYPEIGTEKIEEAEKEILPQAGKEEKPELPQFQAEKADDETEAQKQADKLREIKFEGRKLKHLMKLSQEKSPQFAVKTAQKAGDACLLDLLHDKLIEKGLSEK